MEQYEIIITPEAERDLNELDDYITFELLAPDTAINFIHDIQSKIMELQNAPKRYRLIEYEPWHSNGVRRMNAKSFAVFFYVDDEYSEVYVQNVMYQKRDLPALLSKLYPNIGEIS